MDEKLTQSNALLSYTTGQDNTCADTEGEKRGVDFRVPLAWLCYTWDAESLTPQCLKQLPAQLKQPAALLGKFDVCRSKTHLYGLSHLRHLKLEP